MLGWREESDLGLEMQIAFFREEPAEAHFLPSAGSIMFDYYTFPGGATVLGILSGLPL